MQNTDGGENMDQYGSDFLTIVDDEGNEISVEDAAEEASDTEED